MVQTAVTEVIQSLDDFEQQFVASRSDDLDFFPEWQTDLPLLNPLETNALAQIRDRFRYQRKLGPLTEGTVNAIVVSPLLALAGFYDAPFRLRSEHSVKLEVTTQVDDEPRVLRGRIDFLVIQNQFWQAVIESKETTFDVEMGIPQLLAYMMGAPSQQPTAFGMVTNGNHFVFVKLQRGQRNQYGFSDTFSMLPNVNPIGDVLRILQRIGAIVNGSSPVTLPPL
jgi:hypothetical protein